MNRRGFTIVELIMVVGVLSVLMTIVTTASMMAMRSAREKRRDAMRVALEASIATWQAADQDGKWPRPIETMAQSAKSGKLSETDAQDVFRMIVQKSTGKNGPIIPLIDPNGLFVAPEGVADGQGTGRSFADARNGDSRRQGLTTDRMVFGYQGKSSGRFHRFNIIYDARTDRVKVSTCCYRCLKDDGTCSDSRCRICHRE